MKRLEAATLSAGALCIVIALAFVDWRAGLGAAGLFLVVSALDWRRS